MRCQPWSNFKKRQRTWTRECTQQWLYMTKSIHKISKSHCANETNASKRFARSNKQNRWKHTPPDVTIQRQFIATTPKYPLAKNQSYAIVPSQPHRCDMSMIHTTQESTSRQKRRSKSTLLSPRLTKKRAIPQTRKQSNGTNHLKMKSDRISKTIPSS